MASGGVGGGGGRNVFIDLSVIIAAGDSIAHATFGGPVTFGLGHPSPTLPEQIFGLYPPHRPSIYNAAIGGTTSQQGLDHDFSQLVTGNLGPKQVIIAFGMNDVAQSVPISTFQANMEAMIALALANGKTPIIPTISYANAGGPYVNIPSYNAMITSVLYGISGVRPGPDLYSFFLANPGLLQPDGIHMTLAGYSASILVWAQSMSWLY